MLAYALVVWQALENQVEFSPSRSLVWGHTQDYVGEVEGDVQSYSASHHLKTRTLAIPRVASSSSLLPDFALIFLPMFVLTE
mmetsp:Transcript_41471/g.107446  ORF Transcript_41471/g.107446 Transcript_41471/m.107446 type:complete len:82 (+) Transcript_41471:745-990(+)